MKIAKEKGCRAAGRTNVGECRVVDIEKTGTAEITRGRIVSATILKNRRGDRMIGPIRKDNANGTALNYLGYCVTVSEQSITD
jgi:hypothetical protein